MSSQIQLGNFFTTGGKTVSGSSGGSGIDTEGLIKGLTEAKLIPATRLQDKIDINAEKSTALNEFSTLIGKMKDAVSALRNPPGVANAADNAFKYRSASIASNGTVAGSEYVTVTASPGTALQSYAITEITSVARARKQSTGDINIASANDAAVSSTPATGQFKAGTFTLNGESITLTDGESLNSVAAKFNAVSADTGISASIIKVATDKYQLSFSATSTGEEADFDFNNADPAGTLVDDDGIFDEITISDKQQAANAEFKFNDTAIVRQTNNISDLVDGLAITIRKDMSAEPLAEINVDITSDQTIAKNSIINFINTYNDLKIFAAKQTEVGDDGLYKETAVLSDSVLFRNTMNEISSQLSSIVGGLDEDASSRLSDLGITFFDQAATADEPRVRNLLTLDDSKLSNALSEDADAVRRVFEFDFNTDNTALRVFSRTNAIKISDFDLTITPSTGTFSATYDTGSGTATIELDYTEITNSLTGLTSGYTLKGKAGTVLEGLVLVYASTADSTANVKATQGIADKLYNIAEPALKTETGSIAIELQSLKDADTRLSDNIAKINAEVETYRQQLLDKFSRLEQAISSINTLLASLAANDDARNNASS